MCVCVCVLKDVEISKVTFIFLKIELYIFLCHNSREYYVLNKESIKPRWS